MKYYIKKYEEPYEPLNKNYPDEVMEHWWLGDDKKFKEAVKNYDNYYGKILPEVEITASKTTPTETPIKTSDWTSEHNVAEDNKKYEQTHQAESLKIASAISNKMNEVGNTIGTTALIGGMTVPALSAAPLAFAGGMLGGILGAKATDKIVDWGTNGKYNTWTDLLVDKADTKYINHNIAEILNPGALVGGTVGGIFTKPVASWAYRNGKYAYNTKFKGVKKGGDMSEYVPQVIKNQVESGIEGTRTLLKELGVNKLPYSKVTYENSPIYDSHINGVGDVTIGFDSKTLKNPFKFYKAYTGGSKAGLNYGFVGGHEYAHTVHPTKVVIYNELGVPINNINLGISRDLPISENSIIYNSKTGKLYPEGEYFTADKLLLESGLFLDINTPRKNIMKGLPNKSGNQAHLRAPLEFDADLYALKNLGYIKDGKVFDEGIKFLMERHNLSKEGVLNTLDDLRTIGYGNAVSGEPINGLFITKPENIRLSGFAGAPDRFGIKPSKLTEAERLGIPKGDRGSYLNAGLMLLPSSADKIKQVGKKYFSKTGHKKLLKTISKKMSKDDITEELELDKELYPERFNTIQPKLLWWDDFEAPDDYVSKRWKDHEDNLFDNYGEYVDTPTPQSQKVFDLYADAMTRKRDYVWYDLPSYLDNGNLIGIKRNNSVVFGFPSKHTNLFTASHFAPENLREGYNLIKSMGSSKVPIMFAVPPDLSKQLTKSNFRKVIEVPQIFNGELIMKDVMINKSVTPEILETEFINNPKLKSYINNDIIDLIRHRMDNLQFDPIKSSVGDIIYKQGGPIHIKEKNKGKYPTKL